MEIIKNIVYKKSSFMELPKYVNLDYLLSVKYTRTVDVSNCISISGTTFVIDTKEILHKKKVELCSYYTIKLVTI